MNPAALLLSSSVASHTCTIGNSVRHFPVHQSFGNQLQKEDETLQTNNYIKTKVSVKKLVYHKNAEQNTAAVRGVFASHSYSIASGYKTNDLREHHVWHEGSLVSFSNHQPTLQ